MFDFLLSLIAILTLLIFVGFSIILFITLGEGLILLFSSILIILLEIKDFLIPSVDKIC